MYHFALLPLDCGWWLGADVVADAVNALDLVDDLVAHPVHELIGEFSPIGSHCVNAGYSTQGNSVVKGALIAHYAYGAVSQKDCAGLPDLVVEFPLAQTVYEYSIGLLQDCNLGRGNIAYYAYSQTRTRERMTAYKVLRNTQTAARTSSLNSHLSGSQSLSLIFSGRPPTL